VNDVMPTGRRLQRQVARHARPASDLLVTRIPHRPFVFVGLQGAGYVRLTPHDVDELIDTLQQLRDA